MNKNDSFEQQAANDDFIRKHLAKKNSYTADDIEEAVTALHASHKSKATIKQGSTVVKQSNQKNTKQKKGNVSMSSNISDLDFTVKQEEIKDIKQLMTDSRMADKKVVMLNKDKNPLEVTRFDDLVLLNKDINNIRPHIKLLNEHASAEVPTIAIVGEEVIEGISVTLSGDSIQLAGVKDIIKAEVSDSIMELSTLDIDEAVKELMKIKLANRELEYLFGIKTAPGGRDFNIFSTNNGVSVLTNASIIDGIDAALKDMDKYYKLNAKVVMTRDQYKAMVKEFANLNLGSLAGTPERYLGVSQIIINDEIPNILIGKLDSGIVGNLATTDFGVEKRPAAGIYKFGLSYLEDYKIIPEALRVLKVQ